MARPVPTTFIEKIHRVQRAVDAARSTDRRHFDFSGPVATGVRLVVTEAGDTPLALSLWTLPQDIAEICSDGSVPATAALLAIDGPQARAATPTRRARRCRRSSWAPTRTIGRTAAQSAAPPAGCWRCWPPDWG